jgi:inward rectifier potassium channel
MYPCGLYADILVSAEAFIGLLGMAMATGILFAKFARPSARVLFSKVAVVAPRDGIKSLMFRMANGRLSQIADASVRAVLVRTERTVEGERVRRVVDLKLVRSSTPVFTFTWTAVHQIKRTSPLYRQDSEALIASDAVIMVTVTGIDETFAQSIHARHIYEAREVLWGFLFVDIMLAAPGGGYVVDYRKFHDVRPASAPEAREGAEAPTK